jgi:hypothetical protein
MKFMLLNEQICINYRGYAVHMRYDRNDRSGETGEEEVVATTRDCL